MASQLNPVSVASSGLQIGTQVASAAKTGLSTASAIPIVGSAVSVIGGLVMGLLANHDRRVKEAKEENAALNMAVAAFKSDTATIFTALNNGDITEAVAVSSVVTVRNWFWQYMKQYVQPKCINDRSQCKSTTAKAPNGTAGPKQPNPCSGSCCATCCIACNFLEPAWNDMISVINKHGGSVSWFAAGGNKYGFTGLPAGNAKYVKPKHVTEAEVTINAATGKLTVGAPAGSGDVEIAKGVVSKSATPDAGGAGGDVIQHDTTGKDVNIESANAAQLQSLLSNPNALLIGAGFLVVLVAIATRR